MSDEIQQTEMDKAVGALMDQNLIAELKKQNEALRKHSEAADITLCETIEERDRALEKLRMAREFLEFHEKYGCETQADHREVADLLARLDSDSP